MKNLKNWQVLAVAVVGLMSSNAFANVKFFKPFLPENQAQRLQLQYNFTLKKNTMTEAQFLAVVKSTTKPYKALAALHGATLVVSADWNDDTVNASADQDGTNWNVHFYGGLARQPAMTEDGMALVVCHELSHHFGGFPFFSDYDSQWGAVEGEADYAATHACAKLIWKNDTAKNAEAVKTVPAFAKEKCDAVYKTSNDRNICYRTANAALALSKILATGDSVMPAFNTPDTSVVDQTNEDHPEAQCRLDTYFNGSLCTVPWDYKVIPGKDNPSGEQSMDAQKEAFKYSCSKENDPQGARPACWFAEIQ